MRMSARVDGVASRVQSAIQMRNVRQSCMMIYCEEGLACLYYHLGHKLDGRCGQVDGFCSQVNELGEGMGTVYYNVHNSSLKHKLVMKMVARVHVATS